MASGKCERRLICAGFTQDGSEELWSQLNLSHMGEMGRDELHEGDPFVRVCLIK